MRDGDDQGDDEGRWWVLMMIDGDFMGGMDGYYLWLRGRRRCGVRMMGAWWCVYGGEEDGCVGDDYVDG